MTYHADYCRVCGERLRNIEWHGSAYISLVCVNPKCDERGKVQVHRRVYP